MNCGSCSKKCGSSHCPVTYTLIEAANTGKPFKKVGGVDIIQCINDDFFKYLILWENSLPFIPTRDDYLSEYTLDI